MADRDFLRRISPDSQFHLLFEALPELCMFAKDVEGRLRVVNPALVRRLRARSEREVLGKTDFDLLPRGLAEKYRADDRRVMSTKAPLLGLVELFLDPRGVPTWHVTNKYPIFARDGRIAGVMGTIESDDTRAEVGELKRAVEKIEAGCGGPLSVRALAAAEGLSLRQFERRFRERLRMSPRALIIRTRVREACERLRRTKDAIADIALDCGFYDQAVFSRQFKRHVGLTPGEYRRRFG